MEKRRSDQYDQHVQVTVTSELDGDGGQKEDGRLVET